MIRSPLGLRLSSDGPFKEQVRQAAQWGARGVAFDAIGDLSPDRLSDTGRREIRQTLRSADVGLIAVCLPTRRPFDTIDQLEDRLARADRAFAMAYELGTKLILARLGAIPPESELDRLRIFSMATTELGKRADHRGVRLAIETGGESGEALRAFLDTLNEPGLAASLDSATLLGQGHDPAASAIALNHYVAHAYAGEAIGPSRATKIANPRGYGFAPGALDWEEYLGALEEIAYPGYLTVWPDSALPIAPQFQAVLERARRF